MPPLSRARGAFRRTRPPRPLFRALVWSAVPAGRRRAGAARVHPGFQTWARPLLAPLSRAPSRPRALVRLLQVDVSTSTTADRSNIPTTGSVVGTTVVSAESRLSTGQPPEVGKARGREHRVSTLPTGIAPGRDFAPTPTAPGTSCREQHPLPCPERRGEKAKPPTGRALALRTPRKGRKSPCFREEDRVFSNPRGLSSPGRSEERDTSHRTGEPVRRA